MERYTIADNRIFNVLNVNGIVYWQEKKKFVMSLEVYERQLMRLPDGSVLSGRNEVLILKYDNTLKAPLCQFNCRQRTILQCELCKRPVCIHHNASPHEVVGVRCPVCVNPRGI